MAYRRTENVLRRLPPATTPSSRRRANGGGRRRHGGVQIAPVAERAGIAAGTVYRYFPARPILSARWSTRGRARDRGVAPRRRCGAGPAVGARRRDRHLRCARAAHRRLAWAVIAEPVDAETDAVRQHYRRALADESRRASAPRSPAAICPSRMRRSPRPALVGALLEGLIGPLAPELDDPPGARRGADAHAAGAARARRGRRPRPRPCGADRAAGRE